MPTKTLSVPFRADQHETPDSASPTKVGFVSLGCPKNLVDSEVMMGMLEQAGAELVSGAEDADVIVVNTCSFIASAQQESVNTILEMAKHKTDGRARKLVVAGCLVERFRNDIRQNIPEVDAVVGTGELEAILAAAGVAPSASVEFLRSGFCNRGPKAMPAPRKAAFRARPGTAPSPTCPTISTTKPRPACWPRRATPLTSRLRKAAIIPAPSASFPNCAASSGRGDLSPSSPRRNAWRSPGVREITLIGQDTTCYGEDFGLKDGLALLLEKLAGIEDLRWVRFLYAYPNKITAGCLKPSRPTKRSAPTSMCRCSTRRRAF